MAGLADRRSAGIALVRGATVDAAVGAVVGVGVIAVAVAVVAAVVDGPIVAVGCGCRAVVGVIVGVPRLMVPYLLRHVSMALLMMQRTPIATRLILVPLR